MKPPVMILLQKNSERLQAVLGVEKDSADMGGAPQNRRVNSVITQPASADDAAGAQIMWQKPVKFDTAAIQAATPVTLIWRSQTVERWKNAGVIDRMRSAFQLSNNKVAHIGDVLSMTMNKTAAD